MSRSVIYKLAGVIGAALMGFLLAQVLLDYVVRVVR